MATKWNINTNAADRVVLSAERDPDGGGLVIGLPDADGKQQPIDGLRTARATKPLSIHDRLICWHPSDDGTDEFEVLPLGQMGFGDLGAAAMWLKHHRPPSLLGTAVGLLYHRVSGHLLADTTATVETLRDEEGHDAFDLNFDTAF